MKTKIYTILFKYIDITTICVNITCLRSQVIYSKQPNLGVTQESLRMVTAGVLVVLLRPKLRRDRH